MLKKFLLCPVLMFMSACVPCVQNVGRLYHAPRVPEDTREDETVLVFPVYYDAGDCNIRDPIIIRFSELVALQSHIRSRRLFGLCWIPGIGPTHWHQIDGLLVAEDHSRFWWFDDLGRHLPIAVEADFWPQFATAVMKNEAIKTIKPYVKPLQTIPYPVDQASIYVCLSEDLRYRGTWAGKLKVVAFLQELEWR